MKTRSEDSLFDSSRPLWLAVAGLIVGTACWAARHSSNEQFASHGSSMVLLQRTQADAQRILELRDVPRIATERVRPNDELIKQVQTALAAAEIPLEKWIGNEPSPGVRLPRTPYKQLGVRLLFDEITMRQIVQFAFHLTHVDPTLTIAQVRFSAPSGGSHESWNVDLTLSYLLYAP
jgi:hypothetical protein